MKKSCIGFVVFGLVFFQLASAAGYGFGDGLLADVRSLWAGRGIGLFSVLNPNEKENVAPATGFFGPLTKKAILPPILKDENTQEMGFFERTMEAMIKGQFPFPPSLPTTGNCDLERAASIAADDTVKVARKEYDEALKKQKWHCRPGIHRFNFFETSCNSAKATAKAAEKKLQEAQQKAAEARVNLVRCLARFGLVQ